MFKKLLFLLIFVMVFFCTGITVMAEDEPGEGLSSSPNNEPVLEDSTHEMLSLSDLSKGAPQIPADSGTGDLLQTQSADGCLISTFGDGHFTSSSAFIHDRYKSSYIDKMVKYYIDNNTNLQETLKNDQPVIMFFEGGSDTGGDVSKGYRNSAVCLVIRKDSGNDKYYICYYDKNSTTYPDYPFAYDYENGHDNYGTAAVLDGIYNIYTRNHRDLYAAFNARTGSRICVPCLYMNKNGSFSVLNGNGINIHLRQINTVSGEELTPTSAGCLLVGGTDFPNSYNCFMKNAYTGYEILENATVADPTLKDQGLKKYDSTKEGVLAGCVVVDRYLGKSNLYKVYKNMEAIEALTAFSTFSHNVQAAGASKKMNNLEYYASNMTGYVAGGTPLLSLPCKGIPSSMTQKGKVLINGVYKNSSGELYYRVFTNNSTYYIRAGNVKNVEPLYDDITIHNYTYPEVKQLGSIFGLRGIVARKYNTLSEVTGSVFYSNGSVNSTYTVNSSDILSSLAISRTEDYWRNIGETTINSELAFRGLSTGTYSYKVTAKVKNYYVDSGKLKCFENEIVLLDKPFIVVPGVTFNANGGTVNGNDEILILTDKSGYIKELPTAEKEGAYFKGWYTSNDKKVTEKTKFTENTEVTAKWSDTPVPDKTEFNVIDTLAKLFGIFTVFKKMIFGFLKP